MMNYFYLLLMLILAIPNVSASWTTYQNDLRNSGFSEGTGYLPLATSNFSVDGLGMDFQPLVSDLNNDNNNEITIFTNNSLILFNKELSIISQAKVGSLLGQPALFDFDDDEFDEIIFNARQNSIDYFFAYTYENGSIKQEFNITLPYDADFSGIKCLNLDGVSSCVFKDKKNYVHIVDMESKIDSYYNTSVYDEARQTVPAIGDLDDDGSTEAVFWFNEDNTSGYGFLVFDLSNKSLETNFNKTGFVDNLFFPLVLGSEIFSGLYTLKGQPVLVDLNNDGKLEIAASAFYDDSKNDGSFVTDWFTELFVYNHNGSKLFSKCEKNLVAPSLGCNDGASTFSRWEGSNPFVLDYDKNGINDICFIKDAKTPPFFAHFSYMALNCYDYNGNEIARINLSEFPDGVLGNAMMSDMNNDGEKDIIISHDIYNLNGKSIFNMAFLNEIHPIAVDIDGNNGLDLLWTRGNRTKVFLDAENYTVDLSASPSDINFLKFDETRINVSVKIKNNGQISVKNAKAVMYNTETLENATFEFAIRSGQEFEVSSVLSLAEGQNIMVIADYEGMIAESDETNNFAEREFEGLPSVYIHMRQEEFNILSHLEPVIADYIKNSLNSGYYTSNEANADVIVYIGKENVVNKFNNRKTLDDFQFGYDSGNIIYQDRIGANPYSALVAGFRQKRLFGSPYIAVMIAGNDIEGDIAGIKEFVRNQARFLNSETSIFVDDEDENAIRVYDYFHLGGNQEHYNSMDNEFRNIVSNALNDRMYNEINFEVTASNDVDLRLKNLKPNISDDYLEYLSSNGMPVEMPVVLARGIHSNLTTWENLASELANTGRDTWMIEITGGPEEECDECPNYNFSDLTDNYWPTLINGVLNLTGREKIQYVGHSNGGRVAIVSLENGAVDSDKIETLIGVAVPSAFEGYSTFGNYFGKYGGQIMEELEGESHVSMTEIGSKMETICLNKGDFGCFILTKGLKSDNKMSFNTDKQYYLWVNNLSDEHIGKNLQLDNFYIIQGWIVDNNITNVSHDFIVTEQDENAIYDNIISANKKHYKLWGAHTAGWNSASVPDRDLTKSIIKDALNKKPLNRYESNEINST